MSGCAGWNSVNPLCRAGQVVGSGAKAAGKDIFSSIAHYFASVANSMVTWLWEELSAATSIDLTSTSIKSDLIATGSIAALVTFALFLIQVIASALRQDPGGLGRAVRGLGVAFLGAAFAVATTQVLLAAVDGLCNSVVQFALGTDMSGLGAKLITAATLSSIGNPAGLLLISLVLIAAVVVVWVALMIRKMLIIISAVFAPIAFSGAASDVSRSWVRRWIEFTLALVFSKLILVIIFMIGLSVLNGAGETSHGNHATQSVTNLAIGALTLLLAGFAPWIAIKMVHFAGDSFHAVHAQASTAAAGAQAVVAAPQKAAATVQRHQSPASAGRGGGSSSPSSSGGEGGGGQPKSGSSADSGGGVAGGAAAGLARTAPALAGVAMATSAASAVRGAVTRQAPNAADGAAASGGPPRTASTATPSSPPQAAPVVTPAPN